MLKIEKEKVKDYGNKLTKREEKIKDLEKSLEDVQKNSSTVVTEAGSCSAAKIIKLKEDLANELGEARQFSDWYQKEKEEDAVKVNELQEKLKMKQQELDVREKSEGRRIKQMKHLLQEWETEISEEAKGS